MDRIRKATINDASRIAEILVYSKRKNYRSIFNDDIGSFVELQVYPLAKAYIDNPWTLENIFVYDDGIIKAMMQITKSELSELYVDPFFEGNGIGGKMITLAINQFNCGELWVLDKNHRAKKFYSKYGFKETEETKPVPGTEILDVKMRR